MLAPAAVPVVATGITFTAISATVVLCRLITRLVVIKNAGADDYFMLAALISSFGFLIVFMFQVKYGLGSHISDVLAEGHLEKFLQYLWATIPVYNLTLTLCKLSIICQYMRVFTTEKVIKLCKIMLGILVVYGCWTIFGSAFMCLPVAYFWDESIKGGHCMSKLGFWFSNSALNITTDLMIFAIPMPLLRQLQLPKEQKIGLMFVFALGAFVCVTSIIRLKSLYDISVSPDTTFAGAGTAIWTSIEINVAISCSSLPALKPLIAKAFPHLLSTGHSRTKSNMYANMSGDGIGGSHHMETLSSKARGGDRDKDKKDGSSDMKVTIQQTVDIYQQSDSIRPTSREGSERSLVGWKAEVFCEEPRAKQPHQHV